MATIVSAISIFRILLEEKKKAQNKGKPVFLKIQLKLKILLLPLSWGASNKWLAAYVKHCMCEYTDRR